eukprot:1271609-Pyramimonas_sp.AAC.1
MPAQWTAVPEPPDEEVWFQAGLNDGVADGVLGPGECARPVLLFGDASGGADSSDGRFIRIGLGLAQMESATDLQLQVSLFGALPGVVQT